MTGQFLKSRSRQNNVKFTATIALLALTIALCLALALLAGRAPSSTDLPEQASDREAVLERFKLSRDSKILLLPVEVQGKKYSFVLDTGATTTVYDTSLRSILGDPVLSGTMGCDRRFGHLYAAAVAFCRADGRF
jgi:hypothetical protein